MYNFLKNKFPSIIVAIIFIVLLGIFIWNSNVKEATYDWASYKDLVLSESEKDEYSETVEKLKEVSRQDPEALSKLAELRDRGGDPEGAVDLYNKSLAKKPSTKVMTNLGDLYISIGDYASARELFIKSIYNTPRELGVYEKLFYLDRSKIPQKYPEMLNLLMRGWQFSPDQTLYFIKMLAVYHKEIGSINSAIKYYEEILHLEPDNLDAQKNLQQLEGIKF